MFLLVRAIFALSLLFSSLPGFSQETSATRLDKLEIEAHEAYSGYDIDDFEIKFAKLIEAYRELRRPQEEAWTQLELGIETEATKLEKSIRLQLRTEPIAKEVPTTDGEKLIKVLVLENGIRALFRPETEIYSPRHDILFYELAREAGFGLVPVTTARSYNGKNGSIQVFIDDLVHGKEDLRNEDYVDERLYALDFVTGFVDRNPRNWGRRPGGGVVAVDNDMIYGTEKQAEAVNAYAERSVVLKSFELPKKKLSSTTLMGLRKLKKSLQDNQNKFTALIEPERRYFLQQIDRLLNPSCESDLRTP